MKKFLKITACTIIFTLLTNIFYLSASAEEITKEWDYHNSIEVRAIVSDDKVFSPADFTQVKCSKVIVASKEKYQDNYQYSLIIVINDTSTDEELDAAVTAISANPIVKWAARNSYAPFESKITLNNNSLKLRVGEKADLKVASEKLCSYDKSRGGLKIRLDPQVYDIDKITENTFSNYGIIIHNRLPVGGAVSFTYLLANVIAKTDDRIYDSVCAIDTFSRLPGILSIDFDPLLTGALPSEIWETNNKEVANFTEDMSTKEKIGTLDKTVTVEALKIGTAIISVTRSNSVGASATENCIIAVYTPFDVSGDGKIALNDAMLSFQYVAGKILLEFHQLAAADVNEDNNVTLIDAMIHFKNIAGKTL